MQNTGPEGQHYEGVRQAVGRTGVSESWIRTAIRGGAVDFVRVGHRILLPVGWETRLGEGE
jgi:hypothetical protein